MEVIKRLRWKGKGSKWSSLSPHEGTREENEQEAFEEYMKQIEGEEKEMMAIEDGRSFQTIELPIRRYRYYLRYGEYQRFKKAKEHEGKGRGGHEELASDYGRLEVVRKDGEEKRRHPCEWRSKMETSNLITASCLIVEKQAKVSPYYRRMDDGRNALVSEGWYDLIVCATQHGVVRIYWASNLSFITEFSLQSLEARENGDRENDEIVEKEGEWEFCLDWTIRAMDIAPEVSITNSDRNQEEERSTSTSTSTSIDPSFALYICTSTCLYEFEMEWCTPSDGEGETSDPLRIRKWHYIVLDEAFAVDMKVSSNRQVVTIHDNLTIRMYDFSIQLCIYTERLIFKPIALHRHHDGESFSITTACNRLCFFHIPSVYMPTAADQDRIYTLRIRWTPMGQISHVFVSNIHDQDEYIIYTDMLRHRDIESSNHTTTKSGTLNDTPRESMATDAFYVEINGTRIEDYIPNARHRIVYEGDGEEIERMYICCLMPGRTAHGKRRFDDIDDDPIRIEDCFLYEEDTDSSSSADEHHAWTWKAPPCDTGWVEIRLNFYHTGRKRYERRSLRLLEGLPLSNEERVIVEWQLSRDVLRYTDLVLEKCQHEAFHLLQDFIADECILTTDKEASIAYRHVCEGGREGGSRKYRSDKQKEEMMRKKDLIIRQLVEMVTLDKSLQRKDDSISLLHREVLVHKAVRKGNLDALVRIEIVHVLDDGGVRNIRYIPNGDGHVRFQATSKSVEVIEQRQSQLQAMKKRKDEERCNDMVKAKADSLRRDVKRKAFSIWDKEHVRSCILMERRKESKDDDDSAIINRVDHKMARPEAQGKENGIHHQNTGDASETKTRVQTLTSVQADAQSLIQPEARQAIKDMIHVHREGRRGAIYPRNDNFHALQGQVTLCAWLNRGFSCHFGMISTVVVSECRRVVVTASFDATIKCWDPNSGELIRELRGHEVAIYCLSLTRNGVYLASGDRSGLILVWDLLSKVVLQRLRGHTDRIITLRFAYGSHGLISTSGDGCIKTWYLTPRCPEAPRKVSLLHKEKTMVILHWDVPASFLLDIQAYHIQWIINETGYEGSTIARNTDKLLHGHRKKRRYGTYRDSSEKYISLSSLKASAIIENLDPSTPYRFRVRAVNCLGRGPWSEPSDIIATDFDKPAIIKRPIVAEIKSRKVLLSWLAPVDKFEESRILTFEVLIGGLSLSYSDDQTVELEKDKTIVVPKEEAVKTASDVLESAMVSLSEAKKLGYISDDEDVEPMMCYITNLYPGRVYQFKVSATNPYGSSTPSTASLSCMTYAEIPAQPSPPLRVLGITKSSLDVAWESVEDRGSAVIGFVIEVADDKPFQRVLRKIAGINRYRRSYTIDNLQPGRKYWCRICAVNAMGNGPFSVSEEAFETEALAPSAPSYAPIISATTSTSFVLQASLPESNGRELESIVVQRREYTTDMVRNWGEKTEHLLVDQKDANHVTVTIDGLSPHMTYSFRVAFKNAIGCGPYSSSSSWHQTDP